MTDIRRILTIRHLAPAKHLGANNAFSGACHDFDGLIANLQAARVLHFGVDQDAQRNWAEVSSVLEMNRQIREALAFITGTAS